MSETPAPPAGNATSADAAAAPRSRRAEYVGEPTRAQIRRRPVWLLALAACLAVAGVFAWLGQWQMEHAIQEDTNEFVDSETARPLTELATAGEAVSDAAAEMVVTVPGEFVPETLTVVEQRMNGGELGAWVVGNFLVNAGETESQLAVALGWAPSREDAEDALERLQEAPVLTSPVELTGRFMPPEAPQVPDEGDDPFRIVTMLPAQLVNIWDASDAHMYSGFLVLHPDASESTRGLDDALVDAGLTEIDSVEPIPPEKINWLNLFYAIEWAVFGGFAIYFWFRLTRDAWEREHELQALREREAASDAAEDDETTISAPASQ